MSVCYKYLTAGIVLIAAACALGQVVPVFDGKMQFDFRTYYYAGLARARGMDPYNLQTLRDLSGRGIVMSFIYPPHSLLVFSALSRLSYPRAYYSFLAAKLISLGILLWLWTMVVPLSRGDIWAVAVTGLLGYRSAALKDIVAGNLSIFEQVMIWGGIVLLLRSRPIIGGIALFLSSAVKLLTAALGPLIFIIGLSAKHLFIWIILTAFCGLLFVGSYLAQPELWERFASNTVAASFWEKGHLNPSSLALFKEAAARGGLGPAAATVLYLAWVAAITGCLVWTFRISLRSRDRHPIIYAFILAYVIVSPKMKDYSTLIAALPTLHVISAIVPRWWRPAACILLWIPLFGYQALILAVGAFAAVVWWIWTRRGNPDARMEATLDPLRALLGMGKATEG